MPKETLSIHHLPSREIAYTYTAAMQFAQHFELNLRAFIYTVDYHGLIEEIPLTDRDGRKRYKDFDAFIDKAACGALIEKLGHTSAVKSRRALQILERACKHRNRLAHSYLVDCEFSPEMAEAAQQTILQELHRMTLDLYAALVISQGARDHAEHEADRREEVWRRFNEELGLPSREDIKRKYVPLSKRTP